MKTHWRAVDLFTDATNLIVSDCKAMAAEHSAAGSLGSGSTARKSVQIFEERSRTALKQMLNELAARVRHRGRTWKREVAEVAKALDEHIHGAPEVLEPYIKLSKLKGGVESPAFKTIFDWSATALRKDLAAFRDGWTSPAGSPWIERHPVLYALGLLVAGAVASQVISVATNSKKAEEHPAQSQAKEAPQALSTAK